MGPIHRRGGGGQTSVSSATRALIYARCSTSEQDYTRQLEELRRDAASLGWVVTGEIGSLVSGSGNDSDLSRIQALAHRHQFDRLMVWELSRLSRRGPGPILHLLEEFSRDGVRVWSHSDAWLQTEGPTWDLLVSILSWVAKFEREMISARTRSAMAQRRALGIHVGRPKGSRDKHPRKTRTKKGGVS